MTIWDLLFTSKKKKTVPPDLGTWYILIPISLLVIAALSIRYVSSKPY